MKSGKQRKAEIKAHRVKREAAQPKLRGGQERKEIPTGTAPCNPENLAPSNSYGVREFVERGYYLDVLFQCTSCLKQEVWSATRQKWWYEVAKESLESRAKLCNSCRRAERERKAEARRVHLEGVAAKLARKNAA
jgi:Probable zinc-ribbon domain